jgi:predicted transcriptional regulator
LYIPIFNEIPKRHKSNRAPAATRGAIMSQAEKHRMKKLDSILLTHQELRVMKVLWSLGGATGRSVYEALSPENDINSYFSILTTLRMLRKKGILKHTKRGKSYFFEPRLTHRQAVRNQIRDLLYKYFDESPEKLVAWLDEHPFAKPGRSFSRKSMAERKKQDVSAEQNLNHQPTAL